MAFHQVLMNLPVECNPESLDEEKLASYVSLGVNRISLGVQSFNDDLLKVCRRRHTSNQAKNVIQWIPRKWYS